MKKQIWERFSPYIWGIISFVLVILFYKWSVNSDRLTFERMSNVFEVTITFTTIVIGFLGAIIPVLLSMRNDSVTVQYIFKKDTKFLFKKYLLNTIWLGLGSVVLTMICLLGDIYKNESIYIFIIYIWLCFFFCFIFSTFRSLKYMTAIIFINENPKIKKIKEQSDINNNFTDEHGNKHDL